MAAAAAAVVVVCLPPIQALRVLVVWVGLQVWHCRLSQATSVAVALLVEQPGPPGPMAPMDDVALEDLEEARAIPVLVALEVMAGHLAVAAAVAAAERPPERQAEKAHGVSV